MKAWDEHSDHRDPIWFIARSDLMDLAIEAGIKDVWTLFDHDSYFGWALSYTREDYLICRSILDSSCPAVMLQIYKARKC